MLNLKRKHKDTKSYEHVIKMRVPCDLRLGLIYDSVALEKISMYVSWLELQLKLFLKTWQEKKKR